MLVVAAVVAVPLLRVGDVVDQPSGDPVLAGHGRVLRRRGRRADVGGDADAGGGFPAVSGPVAGGVEPVVVQGGGRPPVAGDRAFARCGGGGAFVAGAGGGTFVPPRVVEVCDGVAQLRPDGAGVVADELADGLVADAVARAMRAEPWPMTCRARSRSRVPVASSRARGSDRLVTVRTAAAVPGCVRLRPEARPRTAAGDSAAAAAIER